MKTGIFKILPGNSRIHYVIFGFVFRNNFMKKFVTFAVSHQPEDHLHHQDEKKREGDSN
tara:strand:+ start:217 stop:393 length:177 start_codon:yes stop_codon:yes gene_type:complete